MAIKVISNVALSIIALAALTVQAKEFLDQSLRELIVDNHNRLRRMANGADMLEMEYDIKLECSALQVVVKKLSAATYNNPQSNNDWYAVCGGDNNRGVSQSDSRLPPIAAIYEWSEKIVGSPATGCSPRDKYIAKTDHNGPQPLMTNATEGRRINTYCRKRWPSNQWTSYLHIISSVTSKVGCWYDSRVGTVCHYNPAGPRPYKYKLAPPVVFGTACSQCPRSTPYCYDKLCTKYEYQPVTVCVAM